MAGCRDDRPPVLLLHGTFSTAAGNFGPLAASLVASGRCVYALNYGRLGTDAITTSAGTVADFARRITEATGAPQIDVVGYSQGGLVLRTALRDHNLAPIVANAVLIAPSFHGTEVSGIGDVPVELCPACRDQAAGSDLLRRLAEGGDLDGDVRYWVLSSERDVVVVPVSSQAPVGPADRVRVDLVEQLCPGVLTDHVQLPATSAARSWTVAVLDGRPGEVVC